MHALHGRVLLVLLLRLQMEELVHLCLQVRLTPQSC